MKSHTYALNSSREVNSPDALEMRRKERSKLHSDNSYEDAGHTTEQQPAQWQPALGKGLEISRPHETMPDTDAASIHPTNLKGGTLSVDTSSSLELGFQDIETTHLTGGSTFDLNMVDLLQGANFDSLFDMIGQQYPNF